MPTYPGFVWRFLSGLILTSRFVELARRQVNSVARDYADNCAFPPPLPPLDFCTAGLKLQSQASKIEKFAEFLELRAGAVAAGCFGVVARLDDCRALGAGAFLASLPCAPPRASTIRLLSVRTTGVSQYALLLGCQRRVRLQSQCAVSATTSWITAMATSAAVLALLRRH